MMTRDSIIKEYFRLCDNVNDAVAQDLLDIDEAQEMRERYNERAERVLRSLDKEGGVPRAKEVAEAGSVDTTVF